MKKAPENYRIRIGPMGSTPSAGNNGAFEVPLSGRSKAFVIASDGFGWEHVSVVVDSDGVKRTPTWAEMCKVKDLFWNEDETVIQYHPAKKNYVNNHKHCLHLWRPTNGEIPVPPPILVGIPNATQPSNKSDSSSSE